VPESVAVGHANRDRPTPRSGNLPPRSRGGIRSVGLAVGTGAGLQTIKDIRANYGPAARIQVCQRLLPRVGDEDGKPVGEAALEPRLERVVVRSSAVTRRYCGRTRGADHSVGAALCDGIEPNESLEKRSAPKSTQQALLRTN
jgi:hypothetical protein